MTITATPPVTTVTLPAVDPERTDAMERVHNAVESRLAARRLYAVRVTSYPAGGVMTVTGLAAYDVIARFTGRPGVIELERRVAMDWTVKGTLTADGMAATDVADVIVGLLGH